VELFVVSYQGEPIICFFGEKKKNLALVGYTVSIVSKSLQNMDIHGIGKRCILMIVKFYIVEAIFNV
jgi:hypothetical protein